MCDSVSGWVTQRGHLFFLRLGSLDKWLRCSSPLELSCLLKAAVPLSVTVVECSKQTGARSKLKTAQLQVATGSRQVAALL